MAKRQRQPGNVGLGVDAQGNPVVDPTQNVLDLVNAAIKRQDDLRDAESRHVREMAALRAEYASDLRKAETERINAVREIDQAAVHRAAEVSAAQAVTMANQVATLAQSTASGLAAALEPMRIAIEDLRRSQYEAQGGRSKIGETRLNVGSLLGGLAVAISLIGLLLLMVNK